MVRNPTANKSLGQHFLTNHGVVSKIADAVQSLSAKFNAPVVEIGPGPGALTDELLARGLQIYAVELDQRMIEHLKAKHQEHIAAGRLTLIQADAMQVDHKQLPNADFIVCGNLPYNVGTQIVFRFLEEFPLAKGFCYMLQKEVVCRFISEGNNADYGTASVKLAWTCQLLGHFWVKPGSFSPPPKVDSGVFWFVRKPEQQSITSPFGEKSGDYLKASHFIHAAFGQRRKMLRAIFPELRNDETGSRRAQELSPELLFKLGVKLAKPE